MNSTGYIYGARADASDGRREARSDMEQGGLVPILQPARVTAVIVPGVYSVVTLQDDGEDGVAIEGVRCFPNAELSVDDLVWLVRWPGNPVPVIMQTGAGASTCAIGINTFGPHFG